MMNKTLLLRWNVAIIGSLLLSACLGSNTAAVVGASADAAAPAGGGSSSDYQTNFDRVQNLGTQTVRQTGTVNYAGQTRVVSTMPGQADGFFIGDVALAVNFDAGSVSGTATNFAGEAGGAAVTLTGTLDTANTQGPNTVSQNTSNVPIIGSITTGTLFVNMSGTLTETTGNQSSSVTLGMVGPFTGANATGAQGAATMTVATPGSIGFDIAAQAGTYYLDRQ